MTGKSEKDELIDTVIEYSGEVPDAARFRNYLKTLTPMALRERATMLFEERYGVVRAKPRVAPVRGRQGILFTQLEIK